MDREDEEWQEDSEEEEEWEEVAVGLTEDYVEMQRRLRRSWTDIANQLGIGRNILLRWRNEMDRHI
jgi:hypothetical protein